MSFCFLCTMPRRKKNSKPESETWITSYIGCTVCTVPTRTVVHVVRGILCFKHIRDEIKLEEQQQQQQKPKKIIFTCMCITTHGRHVCRSRICATYMWFFFFSSRFFFIFSPLCVIKGVARNHFMTSITKALNRSRKVAKKKKRNKKDIWNKTKGKRNAC